MRAKLTYANVMSTLAVFLAVAGGAWAVASGKIGSHDIKRGAVHGKNIKNRTIAGRKLRPDTLKGGRSTSYASMPRPLPAGRARASLSAIRRPAPHSLTV